MVTNSSMTHYHALYDEATRATKWVKYNYENVMFQGGKGSSLNKGYTEANDVKIRLPYSKNPNIDINNFKIGDIVIKGTLNLNISMQSDLKDYETFNITSITDNDFGVLDIQHIHLEGK